MTTEQNDLSMDDRIQLLASADEERLAYFLQQVKTTNLVWSLKNEEGFVMVETEDGDCVMLWPDEIFASQWATDEWSDCEATAVPFTEFVTIWLPSLQQDEIDLAIFPNIEDEGKMLNAAELIELLT
ncbi:DUF2750 domain-containing protein [Marinomonas agarivorans]|nr:DUF2750 domain-containing protein [Marinomonas agarivorans]